MRHTLRYTVKAKNGTVYTGKLGEDIKKTLDRRGDRDVAQVVYEIHNAGPRVIRLWTDETAGVTAEYVPATTIILPPGVVG